MTSTGPRSRSGRQGAHGRGARRPKAAPRSVACSVPGPSPSTVTRQSPQVPLPPQAAGMAMPAPCSTESSWSPRAASIALAAIDRDGHRCLAGSAGCARATSAAVSTTTSRMMRREPSAISVIAPPSARRRKSRATSCPRARRRCPARAARRAGRHRRAACGSRRA